MPLLVAMPLLLNDWSNQPWLVSSKRSSPIAPENIQGTCDFGTGVVSWSLHCCSVMMRYLHPQRLVFHLSCSLHDWSKCRSSTGSPSIRCAFSSSSILRDWDTAIAAFLEEEKKWKEHKENSPWENMMLDDSWTQWDVSGGFWFEKINSRWLDSRRDLLGDWPQAVSWVSKLSNAHVRVMFVVVPTVGSTSVQDSGLDTH